MPLFSSKKSAVPIVVEVVPDTKKTATPKKGQPTRKRSDAQAARRRPIVSTTTRSQPVTKEEKAAAREKERHERDRSYAGYQAGEEKYLPARDKGAQRRYIRQYIDARFNLGEFFMPVALVFIVANFLVLQMNTPIVAMVLIIALYILVFAAVIDTAVMWFKLKKLLLAKFGNIEQGTLMYSAMRALQLRRMRIPKPMFESHGNYPS